MAPGRERASFCISQQIRAFEWRATGPTVVASGDEDGLEEGENRCRR